MIVAQQLEEALSVARRLGFQVREEDLEGAGGGHCSFAGRKLLLIDVTQSCEEQLRVVIDALRDERLPVDVTLSAELTRRLNGSSTLSKAA